MKRDNKHFINSANSCFLNEYERKQMNHCSSRNTLVTNEVESDDEQKNDDVTPILHEMNPDVGDEDMTGLKLLRQFDFHFLSWSYIMCASLQLTFQVRRIFFF